MIKDKKTCRIDIRTSKATKEKLEKAAKRANLSLSSYVISVSCKQANLDLEPLTIYKVNGQEYNKILYRCNHPRKPTKALKKILDEIKEDKRDRKE